MLGLAFLNPAFDQLSCPDRSAGLMETAADQGRVFF